MVVDRHRVVDVAIGDDCREMLSLRTATTRQRRVVAVWATDILRIRVALLRSSAAMRFRRNGV